MSPRMDIDETPVAGNAAVVRAADNPPTPYLHHHYGLDEDELAQALAEAYPDWSGVFTTRIVGIHSR